jgi:hypothetical protein
LYNPQEVPLGFCFRIAVYAVVLGVCSQWCLAAETPKVLLDADETLFTVLTSINACGYDQELASSDPVRAQVRAEVAKVIEDSRDAAAAADEVCQFYKDHQQVDSSRELAQYVSLALYLEGPPNFSPRAKEGELPPDATKVVTVVPQLAKFYAAAGIHDLWLRHHHQYETLIGQFHDPVAKMMFDTDIYLKLPSAGYLGRRFIVYVEPMGAPAQTNARVYGTDYFVVISPGSQSVKMDQIRHTYLHYVLDPMAGKHPEAMQRLTPLLQTVTTAPMDDSFKNDISLLVTESLIRAIEIRTTAPRSTTSDAREGMVDKSDQQGFVLTRYFYEAMARFEKSPIGFRDGYGDLLAAIDVGHEAKHAAAIEFASQASPEVVYLPRRGDLLVAAEKRLSTGDAAGAQKLAQQALDEHREDPGRALFILAQVATANRDMEGARSYFQRALGVAKEPKVVAWSHIYLGRIFDLQEDREAAVDQYQAALQAGNSLPEAKAAAERGLKEPYEPPHAPQPQP